MANSKRIGSLSEAILEVAKYITKASSWKKLKAADLLDAARIERWPRMFEIFGSFRSDGVAVLEEDASNPVRKTILDTELLSDADETSGWRGRARKLGAAKYLEFLGEKIAEQSEFRIMQLKFHYSAATFWRLKDDHAVSFDDPIKKILLITQLRDGSPATSHHLRLRSDGTFVDVSTGKPAHDLNSWSNDTLRAATRQQPH